MAISLDLQPGQSRRRLDLRLVARLLADGPPETITMAAIARGAGVAKPTLYRLAGSRRELVDSCLDAEVERLIGFLHEELARLAADAPPSDAVVIAVGRLALDSPGGFRLLFEQRVDGAESRIRRAESVLAGLLRGTASPQIAAAARLGAAAAAISRSLADQRDAGSEPRIDRKTLQRAMHA